MLHWDRIFPLERMVDRSSEVVLRAFPPSIFIRIRAPPFLSIPTSYPTIHKKTEGGPYCVYFAENKHHQTMRSFNFSVFRGKDASMRSFYRREGKGKTQRANQRHDSSPTTWWSRARERAKDLHGPPSFLCPEKTLIKTTKGERANEGVLRTLDTCMNIYTKIRIAYDDSYRRERGNTRKQAAESEITIP